MDVIENNEKPGTPSPFVCPECSGVLWEITEGDMDRFRCRVGHSYSAESILTAKEEAIETALWAAVRALEEGASLAERSAERAMRRKLNAIAARFQERAEAGKEHARLLRDILLTTTPLEPAEPLEEDPGEQLTGTE